MTPLKVQIEQTTYEGTAAEIMDRLRKETFDPTEFPDTESFLWFLRSNAIRMTGIDWTRMWRPRPRPCSAI